ncbi:MAG: tetratricopeptide repeat protein [Bacteroidota bacterium]
MKKNYKISVLFVLIHFSALFGDGKGAISFAQNRNIDSLQLLLKKDNADTNKVIHSNFLCREYAKIGLYDSAMYVSENALQLAQQLNFKKGIAKCYNNIGIVYSIKGNYPQAIDNFLKALKINEALKNKNGIAVLLGNIGNIYKTQDDYPKALYYYFKALKMTEELGDKASMANNLANLGVVSKSQGDYPKALNYYFKSLKINEELGNKNGIADILVNLGIVYDYKGEREEALNYYFKALKMNEELGNKRGLAAALSNIGSLYSETGKFKEAEQYLKKAITIGNDIGALDYLRKSEEKLSELYDTTGRHKEALIHYKSAIALKDTIYSQENKKELVRKEMNYEFDKKEAATKAENDKQKAIAEEKNRKQKIITWSVVGGLLLVVLFSGFIFRSLRITRKQKQIIEIKNSETELQKKIIEEKNKDITDSIRYAKRIQEALMGEKVHVSAHLPEHFILFMPKDIVSGDFHWGAEKNEYWYFSAVDCTGHGVPGAVMSMLGISFLNDIVFSEGFLNPAEILNRLRDRVVKELRQTAEAGGSKDGMDISLCRLNLKTNELQWAGAYNPLNIVRNGQLEELKGDKQPIGYHPENRPFTNYEIQLKKGDSIYLYSDGYADQFGGPKGKKFKYKQLEDLLIANNHLPLKDQKEILKNRFTEWKGSLEQVDDVCVFGVRL